MRVVAVTQLTEEHDLANFTCGDDSWDKDLNEFLREDALNDQVARLNKTYLFLDAEGTCVGFVAVLAGQTSTKPTKIQELFPLPEPPYAYAPALHVGRIAVQDGLQGEGNGKHILSWVRHTANELAIGCRFIVLDVDPGNVQAIKFYEREGFFMISEKPKQNGMLLMLYDLHSSEDID